ncbi:MAG: hypothetical protein AAFY15_05915 [Cyanobacteria bacterium J06648_11]
MNARRGEKRNAQRSPDSLSRTIQEFWGAIASELPVVGSSRLTKYQEIRE